MEQLNIIQIKQGDITKEKVDAIVNAANKTLLGGGGVDGAIHYAAGSELLEECKKLGDCETGEAKITKGYNLTAKYVIHTVGPVYGHEKGSEEELLYSCYWSCLKLAKKNRIKTIAFPCISTGVFKYPKDEAAKIAIKAGGDFIKKYPDVLEKIIFVTFLELDFNIYNSIINNL